MLGVGGKLFITSTIQVAKVLVLSIVGDPPAQNLGLLTEEKKPPHYNPALIILQGIPEWFF